MKYFVVESIIKNPNLMNDKILKEHIEYTKYAMEKGLILISGLKKDMSGSMFIMKSSDVKDIEDYLKNEPLKIEKIQDYTFKEFEPHYFNGDSKWFEKE